MQEKGWVHVSLVHGSIQAGCVSTGCGFLENRLAVFSDFPVLGCLKET